MKKGRAIALTLVALLLLATVAASAWFHRGHSLQKEAYHKGYPKIEVGMSKSSVIELLGRPAEITNCYAPGAEEELQRKCVEKYWYRSSLEQWGISFDRDGKVIHKTYNVSY